MDHIQKNTKTTSYFGIQYLLAGNWRPDRHNLVEFEKALINNGLDFSQTQLSDKSFVLIRSESSPLQIKLESSGPQVMSIHITAQNPAYDLEMFCRDVEAVISAFQSTWPADQYQLLNTTGKIHHLYSSQTHAFKYLWETRLCQQAEDFKALGSRPVAGGGLRLLMPPHSVDGAEPVSIELRIESFLRETNKLFVETVFTWPRPRMINSDEPFGPHAAMAQIERFAAEDVWNFIVHSRGENGENP